MPSATIAPAASSAATSTSSPSRPTPPAAIAPATDDEILGIASPRKNPPRDARQLEFDFDAANSADTEIPSEASAATSSGPAQPRRTDAQSRNLSSADQITTPEPAHLRATFESNPDLRAAWHDAHAYRASFATPEAAREATALVADFNRMDALFFSRRPEDHAALARTVAGLDPAAFASLARAMNEIAAASQSRGDTAARNHGTTEGNYPRAESSAGARHAVPERDPWQPATDAAANTDAAGVSYRRSPAGAFESVIPTEASAVSSSGPAQPDRADAQPRNLSPIGHAEQIQNRRQDNGATNTNTAAESAPAANNALNSAAPSADSQLAFLHSANAAAVEGVIGAIELQVERLLPEGVAKNARTRVVGEIYRELDSTLRSNPQFAAQLRDAFRSGSLDDAHQRAIVSLLTSRARQALPAVAKRVLNEWTSTIVSAANERRTRQRTAERRVDIAGSGGAANDGRRSMSPSDLDYSRLSDADILNL